MQTDVDKLIKDPEYFLTLLNQATESHIDELMHEKTAEWKERNPKGVISGSSFATCIRQSWYRYFAGTDSVEVEELRTKLNMWLGFVYESEMGKIIDRMPGVLYYKQNEPPVNMRYPELPINYSATTDFVKGITQNETAYFIPIEVKSTGYVYKWDEFRYWEHHLRQLLNWIHYAKKQGRNIPYGVLHYVRRDNFSPKDVVIAVDTPFRRMDRVVIDYNVYEPFIEKRVQTLLKHIQDKTLPAMPSDVPKFICHQCPWEEICYQDAIPNILQETS